MKKIALIFTVFFLMIFHAAAQITITESAGWLESAYAKWTPYAGATGYNVYFSGQGLNNVKVDNQLIRSYGTYIRVDVLGLAAGTYTLKVVPVVGGVENSTAAAITPSLSVKPNLREGFAFTNSVIPGAYNMDGTPKSGAIIIYLTEANANTLSCDVKNDKGIATSYSGIMNILTNRGKGNDKTPLIIRMIGTVKTITGLNAGNFFYFGGFNSTTRQIENITVEGVGDDATAYGYGFGFKRAKGIEIRNIGIMMFGDDGVGMDTDNFNIWIHNCDFFYGKPGSDADQVKGDGSIDMKYNSTRITLSYNHFWDSGKVMGCGGATGEPTNLLISYHHNWFDHADSRCPRLTNTTAHVYNNYYDGVAKYGVGTAYNASAFVESNYFRGYERPITISGQGTDTYDSANGLYDLQGTFSGQAGGMAKSYNNKFDNCIKYVPSTVNAVQFDAYEVSSRSEILPATVKAVTGGYVYNNFDTDPTMYVSNPDSPDDAKTKVIAYAGRMNGGDFKWTFNNAVDDANSEVNAPLKASIVAYQSKLVAIQSEAGVISGVNTPSSAQIGLYPNPVINTLNISSDVSVKVVEIYSLAGILLTSKINAKSIDMNSFTKGAYIVVVGIENGKVQKMIIKE
jgi:pectate lyase